MSKSERDFSHKRAIIPTSKLKRAKFKTARFLRATACNALRVLAIVEASVRLSVRQSHSATVSERCKL